MKLSKRDVAEDFISHFRIAGVCNHKPCSECPFYEDECPGNGVALVQCIRISEKWLKDNPDKSGWKDLTLSDPPDLTKLYNFLKYEEESDSWYDLDIENVEAVCEVEAGAKIRYLKRLPEKKEVSHEDIMTKWWKVHKSLWMKVSMYNGYPDVYSHPIYIFFDGFVDGKLDNSTDRADSFVKKEWFVGRESANIPPEHDGEQN